MSIPEFPKDWFNRQPLDKQRWEAQWFYGGSIYSRFRRATKYGILLAIGLLIAAAILTLLTNLV